MHPAVSAFLKSLSYGGGPKESHEPKDWDPVGRIAQVYEVARNAMEYRAEHLVRRGAIERILKRQLVFGTTAAQLAEVLRQELRMARYANDSQLRVMSQEDMQKMLGLQLELLKTAKVDRDWLLGMYSAEIEDRINPNSDYQRFTTFAFHVFKTRVRYDGTDNIDLLLYVAVDKTYSQSDDAQVSHHLYKLIKSQTEKSGHMAEGDIVEATWKSFEAAKKNPFTNQLSVFVRKQMGPLVLLRDMYFANPVRFKETVQDKEQFTEFSSEILAEQMGLTKKRMNTAAWRSLIYVFLTKMIFGLILEVPAERWLAGEVNYLAIGINTLFPVVLMWYLTSRIRLPGRSQQERVIHESWETVSTFDKADANEMYHLREPRKTGRRFMVFYSMYLLLFFVIFALVVMLLRWIGMGVFSSLVFLFFLSVVSFFAFRIRQTSQIYNYRPRSERSSSWGEMFMLPIVVVGGWLSREVSRLNFLVFIFDFILEAPLKTILRFLDSWSDFLSLKKDEVVG